MKSCGIAALAILATVSVGHANAQGYFGIGIGSYEMTTDLDDIYDGLKGTNDIKGLEGILGFEQNAYVAWEARLGLGLGSDNMVLHLQGESTGTDLEYKAQSYFSGYFRPQYKGSRGQLYGLLGYTSISGEASFDGEKEDTSDDGFSYGVGAGFQFSEVNSLNIEWKMLAKIDGGEAEGLSINFQRKF